MDTVTGKPLMDKSELLGALMRLAKVSAEDSLRTEWRKAGSEQLAALSKEKPLSAVPDNASSIDRYSLPISFRRRPTLPTQRYGYKDSHHHFFPLR